MLYKILLYLLGILLAIGGIMATIQFSTVKNMEVAPDFVGLAALFGAAMLATSIMYFVMAQVKDPKTRIMVSGATISWLVLNVAAHYANVMRGIEDSLLVPLIISGTLVVGFTISILKERKKIST